MCAAPLKPAVRHFLHPDARGRTGSEHGWYEVAGGEAVSPGREYKRKGRTMLRKRPGAGLTTGFTLIELLVVIAVIAILMAMVFTA